MSIEEISGKLNITPRWVQQQTKNAFNTTYKKLTRLMWVYFAVKFLHETNLDNKTIAAELAYTELSSMDRDFRKVLGISPNEVRKKLLFCTPQEVFLKNHFAFGQ